MWFFTLAALEPVVYSLLQDRYPVVEWILVSQNILLFSYVEVKLILWCFDGRPIAGRKGWFSHE